MRKYLYITICFLVVSLLSCSDDKDSDKIERIAADVESITIPLESPYHLQMTTIPSEYNGNRYRYEYSSSNTDVCTVDPYGVIMPKSAGKSVITIVLSANRNLSTTVNVTVVK